MRLVWETTVASRLHPGGRLYAELVERAKAEPVLIAAPTVMEVVRGLVLRARSGDARAGVTVDWFSSLAAGPAVEVVPFAAAAAKAAGEILAVSPVPPTVRRRGETKGTRRARWVVDVQIAATAWINGHGILTRNRRDFDAIAGLLDATYPGTPPLEVAGTSAAG